MGVAHYLPQPALPEVPGRGGAPMAGRPRGGAAAGPLLSRRLHPAGGDRRASRSRTRPPSTTSCSRTAAETLTAIAADPEASRRAHRPHRRAAHLGLGADPSSPCPRHRSRRRPRRRTGRAGSPASPASSCPCACSRACSAGSSSTALAAPARRPAASPSSATSRPSPTSAPSTPLLAPLRRAEWVVYAKRPFAGPQAVLAYLARYTHRVAISNSRLIALDDEGRHLQMEGLSDRRPRPAQDHDARRRTSSSAAFSSTCCRAASTASDITACSPAAARARQHRARPPIARRGADAPQRSRAEADSEAEDVSPARRCPCCGGRMIIVETFEGAAPWRSPSPSRIRIDTS